MLLRFYGTRVLTLFLFAFLSAVLCIFDSFSLLEGKRTDIFGSFCSLPSATETLTWGWDGRRVKLAAFRVWFLFFNLKNSKAVICVVLRPHFPVEICLLSLWLFPTVVVPLWFFIWHSCTTNLIGKKNEQKCPRRWPPSALSFAVAVCGAYSGDPTWNIPCPLGFMPEWVFLGSTWKKGENFICSCAVILKPACLVGKRS